MSPHNWWAPEESLGGDSTDLLLIGAVFVSGDFMGDHVKAKTSYRFSLPNALGLDEAAVAGVPVPVVLAYVDAIAWNEDVKYQIGKTPPSIGRQNTLLTMAHFIAVAACRARLGTLLRDLSHGRGVAPLSIRQAMSYFPLTIGGR
jgi:hypothetical protein